jgi:hypothetical protein
MFGYVGLVLLQEHSIGIERGLLACAIVKSLTGVIITAPKHAVTILIVCQVTGVTMSVNYSPRAPIIVFFRLLVVALVFVRAVPVVATAPVTDRALVIFGAPLIIVHV